MNTKTKLIAYLGANGPSRVKDLTEFLGISPQAVHCQLKKLCDSGHLEKRGSPPVVFYGIADEKRPTNFPDLRPSSAEFIDNHFFRISPDGRITHGVTGFQSWVISISQINAYVSLAEAYVKTRGKSLEKLTDGYAIATQKIVDTFDECFLDELIYQDFWSIPQFGKTRLGHMVTLGKSGQQRSAIKELAESGRPLLTRYIQQHGIQAIAFAPHSIPRKLVFLKTYENYLKLNPPTILFVKAMIDGHPVAQKSLIKLSERIENARNTIFPANRAFAFERVLIIDDALGSGATMNEMARKLKQMGTSTVFGFAIVGSMKGFEVIPDV